MQLVMDTWMREQMSDREESARCGVVVIAERSTDCSDVPDVELSLIHI